MSDIVERLNAEFHRDVLMTTTPHREPTVVHDISDIGAFIDAFLAHSPAADMNGDGVTDLGDVHTFVDHFLNGCVSP